MNITKTLLLTCACIILIAGCGKQTTLLVGDWKLDSLHLVLDNNGTWRSGAQDTRDRDTMDAAGTWESSDGKLILRNNSNSVITVYEIFSISKTNLVLREYIGGSKPSSDSEKISFHRKDSSESGFGGIFESSKHPSWAIGTWEYSQPLTSQITAKFTLVLEKDGTERMSAKADAGFQSYSDHKEGTWEFANGKLVMHHSGGGTFSAEVISKTKSELVLKDYSTDKIITLQRVD